MRSSLQTGGGEWVDLIFKETLVHTKNLYLTELQLVQLRVFRFLSVFLLAVGWEMGYFYSSTKWQSLLLYSKPLQPRTWEWKEDKAMFACFKNQKILK